MNSVQAIAPYGRNLQALDLAGVSCRPVLLEPKVCKDKDSDSNEHHGVRRGQERLLAGLARRIVQSFPAELFSKEIMVLGGQVLCSSAGIALTVVTGGSVPVLVLATIGLAIAVADVLCLIYHHQHKLPMAHDSIGNLLFLAARRFFNQRQSMDIARAVSFGGRATLTVMTLTHAYWGSALGGANDVFQYTSDIIYGVLAACRYGMNGKSMTGIPFSEPLLRLLNRWGGGPPQRISRYQV